MKHLICLLSFICSINLFAEVVINKENCTITKDGKTFPLYGTVEIVDIGADLTVEIVDIGADLAVEINDIASSCCEFEIVDIGADLTVEIVDIGADLTIEIVDIGAGF